MKYDKSKIEEFFKFEEFRDGQRGCIETILEAFDKGKRFVVLEAPTGSGKSVIGMTVSNFFDKSYYLTIQKILQDQLTKDFTSGDVKSLKGRNAYVCDYWDKFYSLNKDFKERIKLAEVEIKKNPRILETKENKKLPCSEGVCLVKDGKSKCQLCFPKDSKTTCPYYYALDEALQSKVAIMNFHSFLYQTSVSKKFGIRDLMILDECFHPYTKIVTDNGVVEIGKLVNNQLPYKVLSFNINNNEFEYKKITRYLKRDRQLTYKVLAGNRVIYPTIDHKIYTIDGIKKLGDLKVGDLVLINQNKMTERTKLNYCSISSIERYEESVTYDLEVEGNHNYVADGVVVSNCHNAEPQLMDFVSLSVNDKSFKADKIEFPKFDNAEAYAEYFDSIALHDLLKDKIRFCIYSGQLKEIDEWKKVALQYTIFMESVNSGNWIAKFEEKKIFNKVTLKPIFVSEHANKYLFDYCNNVLMMSATILSPNIIYESLGIDPSEAFAYRMKNRFPVENRPIYFTPIGSMSYKSKEKTKPQLLSSIETICSDYGDKKGIIHTHNFEIAEFIINNCSTELRSRLLYQKHFDNKDLLLAEHGRRVNSIILAPAMHEGLDLKDDLSRFQLICKIPFPSLAENEQLKARIQVSPEYMDWLTSLKLVQSVGRSIRTETDWADTFILDSDFSFFRKKASKQLPDWFKEAIIDSEK